MYIVVKKSDNTIIMSANNRISERQYTPDKYDIFEIESGSEPSGDIVGRKLADFEEV